MTHCIEIGASIERPVLGDCTSERVEETASKFYGQPHRLHRKQLCTVSAFQGNQTPY